MKESNVIHLADIKNHESLTVENQLKLYKDSRDLSVKKKTVLAFMLDVFIVSVINILINVTFVTFINDFLVPLNFAQKIDLISVDFFINFSVFMATYFGYFAFFPLVLEGRTPGKIWMKLHVVTLEFKSNIDLTHFELSTNNLMKRALGYLSFYLTFGVTYFMSIFDKDNQSFADTISDSTVVSSFWLEKQLYFRALHLEQVEIEINSLDIKRVA